MNKRTLLAAFFLATILDLARAEVITGIVIGVSDGDTITVLDDHLQQHKVRLAGIDAPEKKQDFGLRAKQSLSAMAFGRRVKVEGNKTDRYNRLVGKVLVGGMDVNLRQIEVGLAWHYKGYEREQEPGDRKAYASAEIVANGLKMGLWAMPGARPAWEFRRHRTTGSSPRLADPVDVVIE